ncbi:porphobilinogen deaminase [Alkaliphilus metalliredigens QYMF]|uniref:Porphobilinogen deaminase n=1 Tax=Alkaliphilus metalliredigens (strain QYMF) TaxID=293826 RepID=HEM3_ALKMQ|nr:hydroxymethylbilane synthase [Alkaliphilus metalliredigens]A6TJD5.1 RecName: Full=Porphobilinogen deaminase; Short=PBG; AltName: Full=Hydroxymethylbilane synthase; Short=HMBS; AltName: Full=Pre-uroporphyrinogen synthase [Alkaliphilus metalliredigens QYMF]ABR46303.1 porphobilinogen deaminase [Alkaliphilus metalliredigens QYMF]
MRTIKIGSRASQLALVQAEIIINMLKEKFPQYTYEIIKITTLGDRILDKTLDKIGGKGLFVKEIQKALAEEKIDLAIHSMKDMPGETPEELVLGAITKREDPRDVLITRENKSLEELPKGAVIGSSSLRRQAQVMALRGDIKVVPIRGNVGTRLGKIETESLDGVILAAAGLNRLGLKEKISSYLEIEDFTPAVGQGALGCEARRKDIEMLEMLLAINHEETYRCVMAERAFLKLLEGGCHVPIGAYGQQQGQELHMTGMVASSDGRRVIKEQVMGDIADFQALGIQLGETLIEKGAKEILETVNTDNRIVNTEGS